MRVSLLHVVERRGARLHLGDNGEGGGVDVAEGEEAEQVHDQVDHLVRAWVRVRARARARVRVRVRDRVRVGFGFGVAGLEVRPITAGTAILAECRMRCAYWERGRVGVRVRVRVRVRARVRVRGRAHPSPSPNPRVLGEGEG